MKMARCRAVVVSFCSEEGEELWQKRKKVIRKTGSKL